MNPQIFEFTMHIIWDLLIRAHNHHNYDIILNLKRHTSQCDIIKVCKLVCWNKGSMKTKLHSIRYLDYVIHYKGIFF